MYIPGNELISANGSVNVRALMQFAHQTAKRAQADYNAFAMRQSVKHVNLHAAPVTYAQHFRDALVKAWVRAGMMQRKVAA